LNKKGWLIGFGVCLALATLTPLASGAPDGLEKVAGDQGFLGLARSSSVAAASGYLFPGVGNQALATMLAGWLGTALVFALAYGAACVITRSRKAGPT